MVFSLISRLVNGVKGGVSASLKGVSDKPEHRLESLKTLLLILLRIQATC